MKISLSEVGNLCCVLTSTTNSKFESYIGKKGILTMLPTDSFYFDTDVHWLISSCVEQIEVSGNEYTFKTQNSVYKFERAEDSAATIDQL
jgi:hypothetical protein